MDEPSTFPDPPLQTSPQPAVQPPSSPPPPREPLKPDYWKESRKRWWLYALALIILAAIIAGGYLIWRHPAKPAATTPPPSSAAANSQKPKTLPAEVTTTYSSTNFNLSFDYPKDWTVTDSGNGRLSVRSTTTTLTDASGQSVDGQVVMTIAKKGGNLGAFDSGNAVAVLDSQKVAYTKPTQDQRADTYLSFLQYAQTTTIGALDGVYITGDYGYQKGQDIPKSDIAKIDPLVSVTFVKCIDSACPASTTTGLAIASSSWSDSTFSGPIVKMLESLAFN